MGSIRLNLKTQEEFERFMKDIHLDFLKFIQLKESGWIDKLIEDNVITETDAESLDGKDVTIRKQQAEKLWILLSFLSVDTFKSKVAPGLFQLYPHIKIPDRYKVQHETETVQQEKKEEENNSEICLRCSITGRMRKETIMSLLLHNDCMDLGTYREESKNDVSWDVLLNAFCGKSKDLTETLKSELTKEMSRLQMPIPENLEQAFSDGFPCTCKERYLRHSSGTSGNSKEFDTACWVHKSTQRHTPTESIQHFTDEESITNYPVSSDQDETTSSVFQESSEEPKTKNFKKSRENTEHKQIPCARTTVRVDGVNQEWDLDILQMYFENYKRSGGHTITWVEDCRSQGFILLTFEKPEVADRVIQRNHTLKGTNLTVTLYKGPRTIRVSGLKETVSEEVLLLYFESKKSGGGEVENIRLYTIQEALVTFVNPSVLPEILKRQHHIDNCTLTVTEANGINVSAIRKSKITPVTIDNLCVEVQGLKENTEERTFFSYFENERQSGGGALEILDFNPQQKKAVVRFRHMDAVERVLSRKHSLDGKKLKVSIFKPSAHSDQFTSTAQTSATIAVRGYHRSSTVGMLLNYFENQIQCGGGEVSSIQMDLKNAVTFVTFKNPDVIMRILENNHTLTERRLIINKHDKPLDHLPKASCILDVRGDDVVNKVDTLRSHFDKCKMPVGGDIQRVSVNKETSSGYIIFEEQVETESPAVISETPNDIVVRVDGVDLDSSLNLLRMYFEYPKRSGGGKIKSLQDHRSQGYVLLTFEEQRVIPRILERKHVLSDRKLTVSTQKKSLPSKGFLNPSRTVEVRGTNLYANKEMLWRCFERSEVLSGGLIQTMHVDHEANVAYITFTKEEFASHAIATKHVLNGVQLVVTPYKASNSIQITGLQPCITKDLLKTYFESANSGGGKVENIIITECKDVAFVTFADPSVVTNVVNKEHRILSCKLTVTEVIRKPPPITPVEDISLKETTKELSVKVRGLDKNTNETMLTSYFGNERRSGGGELKKVHFNPKVGRAVITFQHAGAVKRVLSRQHTLNGKPMKVRATQKQPTSTCQSSDKGICDRQSHTETITAAQPSDIGICDRQSYTEAMSATQPSDTGICDRQSHTETITATQPSDIGICDRQSHTETISATQPSDIGICDRQSHTETISATQPSDI